MPPYFWDNEVVPTRSHSSPRSPTRLSVSVAKRAKYESRTAFNGRLNGGATEPFPGGEALLKRGLGKFREDTFQTETERQYIITLSEDVNFETHHGL